ncbi:hypothetical protein QQ045_030213 [Rhodiola kirilowii]
MGLNQHTCIIPDEEDFLDFEVNSASSKIFFSRNSPPEKAEFEFQMSSSFHLEAIISTPADELFCDGKMLPLQQKQAHTSSSSAPCSKTVSQFHVTPFQSLKQSNDLKFDDYFIDYDISNVIVVDNFLQKSCFTGISKRHFLGLKLQASREYLKSLFRKKTLEKEKKICRDSMSESTRSLSRAMNWLSKSKRSSVSPIYSSASSSSSLNPSLVQNRNTFISEAERSIIEAIIHCKQSHLQEAL